jgi:hypothetical protein
MSDDFPHDLLMHEFGRIGYPRRNRAEIEGGSVDLSQLAEAFAARDRVNAELHALHRALDGGVIPKTSNDVPLGEACSRAR